MVTQGTGLYTRVMEQKGWSRGGGDGEASYRVKLTNYTVLAFQEKTILVEKSFSLNSSQSHMTGGHLEVIEFHLPSQEVQCFTTWV